MDKIAKALSRLTETEKNAVKNILKLLENNDFKNLNIKKLKGYADIFRIRKGKIRIIYRIMANQETRLLAIERRSENTYRDF